MRAPGITTAAALSFLVAATALAEEPSVTDGGYMQTVTKDGKAVPLPLEHTDVHADVAGFMASVQVTQTFVNPFDQTIEAVYVFPLPERAAIYGLTMKVGDRVIVGKVKEREEARRIYEQAKAEGKTAALLDQERPNIFTQSVANILPGEEIEVKISYVENLEYSHGEYEFVFPTVVGPRFIDGAAVGKSGHGWSLDTDQVPDGSRITPPLLKKGMRPGNDVSITLHIDAGMAIEKLHSPTHQVIIERRGEEEAKVTLAPKDRIPNKDFVLRYQVAGKRPRLAFLTEKDERGGYFLLMLQPRLGDAQFEVAPREFVFVVDTSGSMHGFPLDQAKKLMEKCLGSLGPNDTFQVIGFAGSANFLFPKPQKATPQNVRRAIQAVGQLHGGGGTRFLPALDLALNSPRDPGRSRVVLFISDGYIGNEAAIIKYLYSHLEGANLFALGVGSSVNRFLIEAMARVGQGEPFYLLPNGKAEALVQRFYEYVSRPSLTDIDVDWGDLDVHDLTPPYMADLFAERPLFVVGRYDDPGKGEVKITGRYAGRPYSETIQVALPAVNHGRGSGISYLWARRKIATLMDRLYMDRSKREEIKKEVLDIALRFNLMSKFTSFVAVDERVRADGEAKTVPVAVPLPQGVSEQAAPAGAYVTGGVGQSAGMPMAPIMSRRRMKRAVRRAPSLPMAAPEGAAPPRLAEAVPSSSDDMAKLVARKVQARSAGKVVVVEARPGEGTGLSKGYVMAAVGRLTKDLEAAYAKVLASDPRASGEVVVRLKLDSSGRVVKVTVVTNPFGDPGFERDLRAAFSKLSFKAKAEGIVVVKLRFE